MLLEGISVVEGSLKLRTSPCTEIRQVPSLSAALFFEYTVYAAGTWVALPSTDIFLHSAEHPRIPEQHIPRQAAKGQPQLLIHIPMTLFAAPGSK